MWNLQDMMYEVRVTYTVPVSSTPCHVHPPRNEKATTSKTDYGTEYVSTK
jgi:hypothetical protein